MQKSLTASYERILGWLHPLAHLVDLAIRVDVALAFFKSGLVKIGNWSGTLYLFHNEYRVPLLPPGIAAVLGTLGELLFPPLLALGLASRASALSLFAVNAVAVIAYWHVLGENEAALAAHYYWGLLLLVTLLHGPGALSVDAYLARKWRP